MANGDITQLLLIGEGAGVIPLVNNFTYQQTVGGTPPALSTLASLWESSILPSLLPLISSVTTFNLISCKQLTGGTDIFDLALSSGNVGTASSSYMPPEVCWSFKYNRASSLSRNGQKRFGLVSSASVADGNPTSGTFTPLFALATALQTAITNGTYTWEPRILRTRVNGALLPVPEVFSISSVNFQSVGTQNSRKFNKH